MEQSSNGWDVSSQRDLCDWSVSTRKERQVHEPLEECSGFTHGGTTKTSCGQRSMAGRGAMMRRRGLLPYTPGNSVKQPSVPHKGLLGI